MLLGEDRPEIVWVDDGVVTIPLFWVDVPTSSERVGLGAQFSGAEADNEVELREILGPAGLSAVELLLFREILEVLVIREDLDGVRGAEEEVSPFLKCLYDRE